MHGGFEGTRGGVDGRQRAELAAGRLRSRSQEQAGSGGTRLAGPSRGRQRARPHRGDTVSESVARLVYKYVWATRNASLGPERCRPATLSARGGFIQEHLLRFNPLSSLVAEPPPCHASSESEGPRRGMQEYLQANAHFTRVQHLAHRRVWAAYTVRCCFAFGCVLPGVSCISVSAGFTAAVLADVHDVRRNNSASRPARLVTSHV